MNYCISPSPELFFSIFLFSVVRSSTSALQAFSLTVIFSFCTQNFVVCPCLLSRCCCTFFLMILASYFFCSPIFLFSFILLLSFFLAFSLSLSLSFFFFALSLSLSLSLFLSPSFFFWLFTNLIFSFLFVCF